MSNEDSIHAEERDEAEDERRRAAANDRRKRAIPVAVERRTGKDRRAELAKERGEPVGERRRQVDPTTCEKDYSDDEMEFMRSMDLYKRHNRRPFPTWSEVLEVMVALGYRKTAEPAPIPGVPVAKKPG